MAKLQRWDSGRRRRLAVILHSYVYNLEVVQTIKLSLLRTEASLLMSLFALCVNVFPVVETFQIGKCHLLPFFPGVRQGRIWRGIVRDQVLSPPDSIIA
jgi:hypothetical protein